MTLTTIYIFFGLLYLGLILEGLRRRGYRVIVFRSREFSFGDHTGTKYHTYHKPDKSLLSETKLGWEDWQPDQYPPEKVQ